MQDLKNYKENHTSSQAFIYKAIKFCASALSQLSISKVIAISTLMFIVYSLTDTGVLAETNANKSPSQTKNRHYREALALIEARDYKSAVNSLTLFLDKHPSSDHGHYLRGKAFHELDLLIKQAMTTSRQ